MLVPGFIDTHVHFTAGGVGLASVQLRDAANREEFVKRIADYAAGLESGEWIIEGIWDHQNWGGELPTREWIDAATPNNPVWISRLDGHMGLANSLAMRLAGVDRNVEEVEGGTVVRGDDGALTGVFKDNAMELIAKRHSCTRGGATGQDCRGRQCVCCIQRRDQCSRHELCRSAGSRGLPTRA